MIDPTDVISYNRNPWELEEFLMFCVLVAGKNAKTTARMQEELLDYCIDSHVSKSGPFDLILRTFSDASDLAQKMKEIGFGCYNLKARSIFQLANMIHSKQINLSTCSVEELESVIGIGPKTARFFLVFSRENQNDIAILDTHILQHLKELGYDVPSATPAGSKYRKIEKMFVDHVKATGKTMAEYDLQTWTARSQK